MRVLPWVQGPTEEMRLDPRSHYAERFGLPVIGPSATWLLRHVADRFEDAPEGFDLDLDETARCLGVGVSTSRHAPLRRALARCVRFGLASRRDESTLAVTGRVPPVAPRHLMRLPIALQEEHRIWIQCAAEADADADRGLRLRRRARLVALDLRELGVEDSSIERHLLRRGVHPATAFEAARWAWSPESAADRPLTASG